MNARTALTGASLLLAGLGITGLAWAASGSALDGLIGADRPTPCADGWAGCLVDGSELSKQPVTDSAGRPMPADLRVSWFDLEAGPAFSPFTPLSQYTGELPAVAAAPEPPVREPQDPPAATQDTGSAPAVVDNDPEPVAEPDPIDEPIGSSGRRGDPDPEPTTVGTGDRRGADPDPTPTSTDPDPEPTTTVGTGSSRRGDPEPTPTTSTFVEPDPEPTATVGTGSTRRGTEEPSTVKDPAPDTTETARTSEPDPVEEPTVAEMSIPERRPAQPAGCDDLVALEPAALMGKLSESQKVCLEGRISSASTITQKDKISRVLLINAEASGNRKEWEKLARRHLEQFDRSDPNLCFKYAQHLSRGGVGRAWGVIKWSDYALENKSQWSGTTYKTRVYALYQLKAEAAMKLWEDANENLVDAGADRDEWAAKEEKYRGMAKDYSREWLDYARVSGQDVQKPMALCVSAAGSKKFCKE